MRHSILIPLCLGSAVALSACERGAEAEVDRAIQSVNVIDESNLNDVMLTAADPQEAVNYFRRATAEKPDRIDLQRGLAKSLIRAKSATQAVAVWARVAEHPEATNEDKVAYADALIRSGAWERAEAVLDAVPPTYETYQRYRLEAMVADSNEEWRKADSFYEVATGLTTDPSGVLNNWGYSKLSRGDYADAEQLFSEAIVHRPDLFTAKNNLVLARGAQRKYDIPVVPMDQTEQAQLMHTMALAAIKQGDVAIGRGLLREAIETHPRHFDAAVRALRALEANVAG
ncbi:tetratricopeptide repeat protein [Tranquillimonas alkanivorans]|uniref:Flp pilus assembly protein TadD, contains TPR repeats n=1 Tax=Tranquillimonas alkanivorans TaxID=441119 RepID=A0A1I5M9J7_9RHOB|nr:tetratricopeptide repeat protein [Tranquillimonas alkanivorans]SFP05987.1 Flp pilus assembly protein TadD, contains TPR repeats [Tranquillimonas alkanivorans]